MQITSSIGYTIYYSTSSSTRTPLRVDYLAPNAPTAISVTPTGGIEASTDQTAHFKIIGGQTQAAGGSATLQIGDKVISTDNTIQVTDGYLDFDLGTMNASAFLNAMKDGTNVTVKITDAVGNVGTSVVNSLPINISSSPWSGDHTAPTVASTNAYKYTHSPTNPSLAPGEGDTTVLRFNEPTDKAIDLSNLLSSRGPQPAHAISSDTKLSWNASGDQLTITFGPHTESTLGGNDTIFVMGVKDLAGNTADVRFDYIWPV